MRGNVSTGKPGTWHGTTLGISQIFEDTIALAWRMRDVTAWLMLFIFVSAACVDEFLPLHFDLHRGHGTIDGMRLNSHTWQLAIWFVIMVLQSFAAYLFVPLMFAAYRDDNAEKFFAPKNMPLRFLRFIGAGIVFCIASMIAVFAIVVAMAAIAVCIGVLAKAAVPATVAAWLYVPLAVIFAAGASIWLLFGQLIVVGIFAEDMHIRQAFVYARKAALARTRIRRMSTLGLIAICVVIVLELVAALADKQITTFLHVRALNLIADLMAGFVLAPLTAAFSVVVAVETSHRMTLDTSADDPITSQSPQV